MATRATRDSSAPQQDEGRPDAALYETIRDQIISEIESGRSYPAGAMLPSVRDMAVRWTVSTTTARRVLAELVQAGYANAEQRGHVSLGPQRTATTPATTGRTSVDTSTGIPALQVIPIDGMPEGEGTLADLRMESVMPEVALALGLSNSGASVLVRRSLTWDGNSIPVQLRTTYLAQEIGASISSADSVTTEQEWDALLASKVDGNLSVRDGYIQARHPTDYEAKSLGIAQTACVLVRASLASDERGTPVAYSMFVWPGDSIRLSIP